MMKKFKNKKYNKWLMDIKFGKSRKLKNIFGLNETKKIK